MEVLKDLMALKTTRKTMTRSEELSLAQISSFNIEVVLSISDSRQTFTCDRAVRKCEKRFLASMRHVENISVIHGVTLLTSWIFERQYHT